MEPDMMASNFKFCGWCTAIAVATVMTTFFVSGCSKEGLAEPEEQPFPSGSIVYEHREPYRGNPSDICISPVADGMERRSESVNLTNDPSNDKQPIFSPDGTKVYF